MMTGNRSCLPADFNYFNSLTLIRVKRKRQSNFTLTGKLLPVATALFCPRGVVVTIWIWNFRVCSPFSLPQTPNF